MPASISKYFDAAFVCALLASSVAGAADVAAQPAIELKLSPRVCTLSGNDTACHTTVRAQWRSAHDESLCLLIVDRPDIRRCWEDHSEGVYSMEISFSDDLIVQLRDSELDRLLASQAIAVIREALQLRRKRRAPWNIFS